MEAQLVKLIVLGSFGLLIMAGSVIFFVILYQRRVLQNKVQVQQMHVVHQEQMLHATLRSQEEERSRLGTELHDSVGAMLSTIKMSLQLALRNNSVENISPALDQMDDTIRQVRSISHQMMPVVLKKYGLQRAIEEICMQVNRGGAIRARFTAGAQPDWTTEQELMVFRIIQELVNNSIKHSGASAITIELKGVTTRYELRFCDNGVGFPASILENTSGIGLWNIKNRAQVLHSEVSFSNHQNGGAQVILEIPRMPS